MGTSSILLHGSRILVGLVFIFSGIVKAIDPLGTIYKIEDYLTAFGGFFADLLFVAYPLAFLLILVELLIGLNLLFNVRFKFTIWMTFAFMLAVVPLTLYIALYNPVSDCGCFGDALTITNWQTFYKNIVLFVLTLLLLIYSRLFNKIYLPNIEWGMMVVFVLSGVGFMLYNLNQLPLLDFRPYKVGVNIPEAMTVPEGAPVDVYAYNFTYAKFGEHRSFGIDQLPDSTWTFVSQETTLVKEGYRPPIHDFAILTADFDDVTDELLNYSGKTYFVIMHDLGHASRHGIEIVNEFYQQIKDPSIRLFGLTASSAQEIQEFKAAHGLTFPFYKMDPITLKTMIRANPGLLLMKNGTIQGKWSWRTIKKNKPRYGYLLNK